MSCPIPVDASGMKDCDPKCQCSKGTLCPELVYNCEKPCPEGSFWDPRSCDCDAGEYGLYLARSAFNQRWPSGCFEGSVIELCRNWDAADIGLDSGTSDTVPISRYDPLLAIDNPNRQFWVKGTGSMNVNGANPDGAGENNNTWISATPGATITSKGNTVNVRSGGRWRLDVREADVNATNPDRIDPEIGGWKSNSAFGAMDYLANDWVTKVQAVNLCDDPKMQEGVPRCRDGFYSGAATRNRKSNVKTTILDYPMDAPEYELFFNETEAPNVYKTYDASQRARSCDNSAGDVDRWNAKCDRLAESDRDSLQYISCYACSGGGDGDGGGGETGETTLPGGNGTGYFVP